MSGFIKFLTSITLLIGSIVLLLIAIEEKSKNCLVFDDDGNLQ